MKGPTLRQLRQVSVAQYCLLRDAPFIFNRAVHLGLIKPPPMTDDVLAPIGRGPKGNARWMSSKVTWKEVGKAVGAHAGVCHMLYTGYRPANSESRLELLRKIKTYIRKNGEPWTRVRKSKVSQ